MSKTILIMAMLGVSLSSFASDTVLRLGEFVTLGGDSSKDYKIIEVKATAYSTTDAGITLSRKGCYESKVDTGQGFPYRYSYTAKETSSEISSNIDGRNIVLKGIEAKKKESREALKEISRFYCMKKTSVNLLIKLRVKGVRGAVYTSLALEKDRAGYYVQKPYGNQYISDSAIDFTHTPGLDRLFR